MCASNASLVTCYRKLVWLNPHSSVLLFVLAYLTGLTVVMNKTAPELPKTSTAAVTSRTAKHNNYHAVSLLRTGRRILSGRSPISKNGKHGEILRIQMTLYQLILLTLALTSSTNGLRVMLETRNKKGEFYTPSTLHQLLCGLFRHMKNAKPDFPTRKILILHSFMEH